MIELWNTILLEPILNFLIVLYSVFFHNFGLAIIVLTIIVRFIMLPLTLKQLRATKAMQTLQPKIQELQKKYGKDKQKLAQETSRLYKESGISPMGCLLPMLVQLPIWIALFYSIRYALADPVGVLGHLYSWSVVQQFVVVEPEGAFLSVSPSFLWLDLAKPDHWFLLPILVGGTMWVQQKMVTAPTSDPRQQSISRMMLWTMPLMFGFLTTQFPSGLALYWLISNILSIALQYRITGWGTLRAPSPAKPAVGRKQGFKERRVVSSGEQAGDTTGEQTEDTAGKSLHQEKELNHGKSRSKRKNSRRSYPASSGEIGTQRGGGGGSSPEER